MKSKLDTILEEFASKQRDTDRNERTKDHEEEEYGLPLLPTEFGKKTKKDVVIDYDAVHRETRVVTRVCTIEEEDDTPTTNSFEIRDHHKTITALALDPSGSRIVSGSRDCSVKYWDFSPVAVVKPFRTFTPFDCNPIRDIAFSNSGDRVLVVTACAHPKIYDRDGFEKTEFPKGDQYIRDMKNTKGHIAALTSCQWSPTDASIFMTSGLDSTVRLWDTQWKWNNKQVIAIRSKTPGGRTVITTAGYSYDGGLIGCGASSLKFTADKKLLTRGIDSTLKLFDLRQPKTPLFSVQAENSYEETGIALSPDDKYVVTGISIGKAGKEGLLRMYEVEGLSVVKEVEVGASSVVRVVWHEKINQIICGSGDGSMHVLYNPISSIRGALQSIGKIQKQMTVDDLDFSNRVFTLDDYEHDFNIRGALMYQTHETHVRDDLLTKKPTEAEKGPSKGRMGSSIMAHLIGKILEEEKDKDEDPREALLKHAKAAEENPIWVAHAYKDTQPVNVLAKNVYENELEAVIDSKKRRRK